MTGIDLLKMAQEGKLNSKTIVKTLHERHYFDDRDEDYYIYQDNMFHRCNENGKLGSKYQDRFLNYEVLNKDFEICGVKDDFTGIKWYADGICYASVDYSEKLEPKQGVICADNPKKVEIPKHIPNEVIQDLDRTICPENVKCIAHKVNEIINYLQYKEKKEEQED